MKILNNPKIKHLHCLGIGGIGVSGLAEILVGKGYRVTGSDVAKNPNIERLTQKGITVTLGHRTENLGSADALVYSSAIHPDNPEYLEAKKRNIPCVSRGELLAEVMSSYTSITVAGTHGKTTTTGMLIHTLLQANQDISYFMGGVLKNLESPAKIGKNNYFVSESDESDASFLYLKPNIAVVTNIDSDHLETYSGSFKKLQESFNEFLNGIAPEGKAILCYDDVTVQQQIPQISREKITFGFHPQADYHIENYKQAGLGCVFTVHCPDTSTPLEIELSVAGRHNVLNALPSIILAKREFNIADDVLKKALANFPGVRRRFCSHGQIQAKNGTALLFEDYGHHPNEIKATLEMVKNIWPDRRLVLAFQPHRYTRTRDLMQEFAQVLSKADVLLLLEIYASSEIAIEGVSAQSLSLAIQAAGGTKPIYVPELQDLSPLLKDIAKANDIVLFQGAGSIGPYTKTVAEELLVHESSK
jgi:UDP-N-acetylmuramate--alanine ligase